MDLLGDAKTKASKMIIEITHLGHFLVIENIEQRVAGWRLEECEQTHWFCLYVSPPLK